MKHMKIKAVIRVISLFIVALIVGFNVYCLNAERLGGNQMPMPFGVGASVVLTDSMKPEFSGGDVIFVTKSEDYIVGDIVVFTDGRIPTVHRIIEINGEEIITKGDNNNVADEPITADRILGKVRFSIPYVGFVINVIKTPAVTLIILLLAVWLMERSIRLEKAEKDKELDKIKEEIRKLKEDNS